MCQIHAVTRRLTGRPAGRPRGSLTTARTDLQLFAQLHRGQARIWRTHQVELQRRVEALSGDGKPDCPTCGRHADGQPLPDEILAEVARIDVFLSKSSAAMVNIREAQEQANAELPTELLEAQLAAELVQCASTWTDHQWAQVMAVRDEVMRKRFPGVGGGVS